MRTPGPGCLGLLDPAETVALVARSRRDLLLAVHRHRLSPEDLEDCYSQATLELVARARRSPGFSSDAHVANALEQRLLSRIGDRRRALSGRSPMEAALATALPLGEVQEGGTEAIDPRADVETLVMLRHDLRRLSEVAHELSEDMRLVLASQLAHEMGPREFCERHGWTTEKYRKVAQRARARLRGLLAGEDSPDAHTNEYVHGAHLRPGCARPPASPAVPAAPPTARDAAGQPMLPRGATHTLLNDREVYRAIVS